MSNEFTPYVPSADPLYVPWGAHDKLRSVIAMKRFWPVYIPGPTGSGKSLMVEQVCAQENREYIRIQITPETDEDSLLGGIRLKDGDTYFQYGPVIEAMRRGAVLMIDEIDRGSNKIMCLQSVMEGKPVTIKRSGEVIEPHPDFTVIATGNTKGQGDLTGRYIAAVVIDDAFLERFSWTLTHNYPEEDIERNILNRLLEARDCLDEVVSETILRWSRQTRNDDDYNISTRRMCMIAEGYAINRAIMSDDQDATPDIEAVKDAVERFPEEVAMGLVEAYTTMRPQVEHAIKHGNERSAQADIASEALRRDQERAQEMIARFHGKNS